MADRYWVANGVSANWNTAANWNTVADGSGSNGVPAATDNVFFGHATTLGANLGNAACVMNTSPTIVQFTSYEGYNDIVYSGEMSFATLVNTITFAGADPTEIGFRVGMSIVVAGTTSNNGTHVINTITATSIVVATALTTETATGTATYNADLDLSGNTLTFTGSGILMTVDSVIKNTSASTAGITINGGAFVGGAGNRYFLAGDNQNFENRDKINMVFATSGGTMYFDDGVYPMIELQSGVSATASYVAPTSNVHGASKFYQINFDNTWVASTGTVRNNLKKKFQVDNTDSIAIRSTLLDVGYSTWTFDTTTTMVIPTDGELTYGTGNLFNVRWYNLIIKNSGNANRLATIGYRRNLDVNSLTVEAGATLRGYATQSIDGGAGGTCTISSTTRPNIKGAWNFKQVADGVYSSILDEAYTITPSHGIIGKTQFSFGGGAFFSHSKIGIVVDDFTDWEATTNPRLQACDGAFMKSSFFAFCQNFDPASGSGENSSIWESNTTPSVLYYTDSAGTHHNLLAGGSGGATELNDLTDVTITSPITDLQVLIYDGTEWVNGWPEVKMIQVRNDEGSTIPAGAPLYSRGEIGGSSRIKVGIADANDSAKMPCIGLAYEEMNTTSTQDNYGVVGGVYNTNLTGFTGLNEGDIVYVKNWTGTPTAASDVLTTTKPAGADEAIQNVGIILKTNSPTGSIIQGLLVSTIGRSNDIPNYLTFQSGAPTPAPTNTDVHIGYGNPYTETLSIRTQYGYMNLGARNASYCHFYTDRNFFYFNRPLQFDGGDGVYAYNGDFWVRTDDASSIPTERLTIKGAQNDTRIGIRETNPQTELDVGGTIRQTNATNAIVHADANGDLGALTVGTGLSLVGSTLSATGGGGGGYPLFKHDQLPVAHGFTPFRLLQNGDAIELGVVSGGDDNKDVSVFTPEDSDSADILVGITAIGTVAANTGREYIFYGQSDRMMATQYIGGAITAVPIYFVESMRDVILASSGSPFYGTHILEIIPMWGANCVRVIDAGVHSVLNASRDGGVEEPEEPSDVRILLIDDYKLYVDISGGVAMPNYRLRDSI
jgi:hypothetical protein